MQKVLPELVVAAEDVFRRELHEAAEKQIQLAVVVVISHTALVVRAERPDFSVTSVNVPLPLMRSAAVVGDEQVLVAVVVEVADGDALQMLVGSPPVGTSVKVPSRLFL
jgi:hypothetical protein